MNVVQTNAHVVPYYIHVCGVHMFDTCITFMLHA